MDQNKIDEYSVEIVKGIEKAMNKTHSINPVDKVSTAVGCLIVEIVHLKVKVEELEREKNGK